MATNARVIRRKNETFENLMRRFTNSVEKNEVRKYFMRKTEYESPSIKRKRKHANALRRMAREKRMAERFEARRRDALAENQEIQ